MDGSKKINIATSKSKKGAIEARMGGGALRDPTTTTTATATKKGGDLNYN